MNECHFALMILVFCYLYCIIYFLFIFCYRSNCRQQEPSIPFYDADPAYHVANGMGAVPAGSAGGRNNPSSSRLQSWSKTNSVPETFEGSRSTYNQGGVESFGLPNQAQINNNSFSYPFDGVANASNDRFQPSVENRQFYVSNISASQQPAPISTQQNLSVSIGLSLKSQDSNDFHDLEDQIIIHAGSNQPSSPLEPRRDSFGRGNGKRGSGRGDARKATTSRGGAGRAHQEPKSAAPVKNETTESATSDGQERLSNLLSGRPVQLSKTRGPKGIPEKSELHDTQTPVTGSVLVSENDSPPVAQRAPAPGRGGRGRSGADSSGRGGRDGRGREGRGRNERGGVHISSRRRGDNADLSDGSGDEKPVAPAVDTETDETGRGGRGRGGRGSGRGGRSGRGRGPRGGGRSIDTSRGPPVIPM